MRRPPTAVIPEMALVMDIRGVWRAGETPHTEKYPVITESEKMLDIVKIAEFETAYPIPRSPRTPPERAIALLNDFWNIFGGSTTFFSAGFASLLVLTSSTGGFGFGHNNYLSFVTTDPLTTSSLKSISY